MKKKKSTNRNRAGYAHWYYITHKEKLMEKARKYYWKNRETILKYYKDQCIKKKKKKK